MKKILSIFILLGFIIFYSCDPMGDIYDELDAQDDPIVSAIEYMLTSSDYSTIADLAIAADAGDTINADFLSTYGYFTKDISFQDYIALYLNDRYKVQGAGSTAKITYNYNDSVPDDLSMYVDAIEYEFVSADYDMANSEVGITEFFYPEYNPDLLIADVLENSITGAANGDIYLINYEYSDVTPIIVESEYAPFFEEDFQTATAYETIAINGWTQYNEAGTETWEGREYSGNTYAQFSAYSTGEASNISWLITPSIDLTAQSSAILNFVSKDGYNNGDPLTVLISTDYTGTGDPNSSTWTDLNPTLSTGNTSSYASYFTESGDVDLDAYCGNTVYIALKYTGGDPTLTTTMQIDDVNVKIYSPSYEITSGDVYTKKDIYTYNGANWSKASDVYCLNEMDYDAMGEPGYFNSFSADDAPENYIPKYLDTKYPSAGDGVSAIVIYKYYDESADNGEGATITLADEYEYSSGVWVSSYSFIEEMTAQWAVSATSNEWVFDPTETLTLTKSDYQVIVDYVKANYADLDASTYDDSEFYFGASSYYGNFDGRTGKWNAEVFDDWQEAAATALAEVMLPYLVPNATVQVNGVQMYYRVVFNCYTGTTGTYVGKFQVTKAGPDPEFTLTEEGIVSL